MPHENVPPFMGSPTPRSKYIIKARNAHAALSDTRGYCKGGLDADDRMKALSRPYHGSSGAWSCPPQGIGLVFLAVICKATVGYRYWYLTIANFVVVR